MFPIMKPACSETEWWERDKKMYKWHIWDWSYYKRRSSRRIAAAKMVNKIHDELMAVTMHPTRDPASWMAIDDYRAFKSRWPIVD